MPTPPKILVQSAGLTLPSGAGNIVLPAAVTTGNLLVLYSWFRNNAGNIPTGFTLDVSQQVGSAGAYVRASNRVAQPGDGSTFTVAATTGTNARHFLMEWSGIGPPDVFINNFANAFTDTTAQTFSPGGGMAIGIGVTHTDSDDATVAVRTEAPSNEAVNGGVDGSVNGFGPRATVGYGAGSVVMRATHIAVILYSQRGVVIGNYPSVVTPALFGEEDRVTDPATVPYVLRAVRDVRLNAGDSIKATVQMSHDVASTFDIVASGLISKTYFSIEKLGSLVIPAISAVPSIRQHKSSGNSQVTLDLAPAPGDTLLAWVATRDGPGSYVGTPAGWTKIADAYNNAGFVRGGAMFRRVVQVGDGTFYAFTGGGGRLTVMEWEGSYVSHVSMNQSGPTNAITCGGEIGSIGTPCVIVGAAEIGNSDNDGPNPGVTPYSGVIELLDAKYSNFSPGTWVGYRSIPEPQGSYTIGGTYGLSQAFCGITVLLTAG